jgi:hypothetical protein
MKKRAPVIKWIAVVYYFLCDCTLTFKRVWWLWCWLTVGLFVCFQVSSRHVIVSDSMESSVSRSDCPPLWTGPRRRRRRRSFVPASKVASMCTVVSGGSDNDAAPFFFSTVYRCCCCCCSFYHFLPIAATPRTLRSIHRGLGNNSKQTLWDGGIFKRSFQQIFNDRHTAWTIKTQGFIQFCEFPRAN